MRRTFSSEPGVDPQANQNERIFCQFYLGPSAFWLLFGLFRKIGLKLSPLAKVIFMAGKAGTSIQLSRSVLACISQSFATLILDSDLHLPQPESNLLRVTKMC